MDGYVTAIADPEARGFRGAAFANKPTPSGCDRYLLTVTTNDVFPDPAAAIAAMDGVQPDHPRLESGFPDIPAELVPPRGWYLETAKVKATGEVFVSVRPPGGKFSDPSTWRDSALSREQVSTLVSLGILEHDSSSGDDRELACIYDTYVSRAGNRA